MENYEMLLRNSRTHLRGPTHRTSSYPINENSEPACLAHKFPFRNQTRPCARSTRAEERETKRNDMKILTKKDKELLKLVVVEALKWAALGVVLVVLVVVLWLLTP